MLNNWHYHPEIELLYVKKSAGSWLIGDHAGQFKTGDVVITGPNLPHSFRHDQEYVTKNDATAGETVCIKFVPEIFGASFLNLPECKDIKQLFSKCGRGLKLAGVTRVRVAELIEKMDGVSDGKKLVYLLEILEEIATSGEYTALSSHGFMPTRMPDDNDRIKVISDYTFGHYDEKITIDKVASLVNMTRQSFCRYFKSKTRKTYLQFLMEVRIGHACRLLVEEEKNVAEISYACGYTNISHFNHQFKSITRKRPLEYKRIYLKNELSAAI